MFDRLRDFRTLLLIAAAAFCAAPAQAGTFAAASDFDGDRRVDIATAGHARREGAGYLLDISIRLSTAETRAITVRTARAAGRMFARDIDGDADRDLVVESFDREPLAVVLNDGGGAFHQGSLSEFEARLRRHDLPFADRAAAPADSPETGECPAGPADTDAAPVSGPWFAPSRASASPDAAMVVLRRDAASTRGPPSL